MITEQYVSFETAKLLKEKGFLISTKTYYKTSIFGTTGEFYYGPQFINNKYLCELGLGISAPTQALAMRWLREVYHIFIKIDYVVPERFWAVIHKGGDIFVVDNDEHNYITYEEAYETAIKYCLENLI